MDTLVYLRGEEVYTRSTAVLEILRDLGGIWVAATPLKWLPKLLRDGVYNFVAAHRYRLFGKKEACPVPTPEMRTRFIL